MEHDMASSRAIIKLLEDSDTAAQFYSALCNVEWVRISKIPEDEQIIDALMGVDRSEWSCSWRYAGGLIAQIRTLNYNLHEDYMDFYCCGNEGHVSELVREALAELGWKPITNDV
jgi:hypothetical protein